MDNKNNIDKTIIGISDQNKDVQRMRYRNWIGYILVKRGMGHIKPDWAHIENSIYPSVSRGRWYVKCPDKTCGGAIAIDENEEAHYCVDCLNIANNFKPQYVVWGSFKSIERLKKILAKRLDYRTRNYHPHLGETIDHLVAENKKHGVEK